MVSISSSNAIGCWQNIIFFTFLLKKSRIAHVVTNIASEKKKKKKKRKWQTKKAREKNKRKRNKLKVQLILSVEQSIKIFHANAVIQHADLTTCKPNFKQKYRIIYGFQNACKCDVSVCVFVCVCLYLYVYSTCLCTQCVNGKQFSNGSALLAKPPFNKTLCICILISCGDGAVTFYTS